MAFTFEEAPESRSSTARPPTETHVWVADGEFYADNVKAYAYGATPAIIATLEGILYRQDIQVQPEGFKLYRVTVPYAKRKVEQGNFTFDFDTSGGSVHIKASRSTVNRYVATGTAADHKQAIGVSKDGVEGADIIIPAMKINCQFTHPLGVVTLNHGFFLAEITGSVNSTPMFGRAAGEILFMGARGSDGSDAPATIGYSFAYEKNLTGLVYGAITDVQKDGWDLIWLEFESAASNDKPVRQPKQVNVERVYNRINLAAALGFGG